MTTPTPPVLLCQHCNQKRARRPPRLCSQCYHTPGVPDNYASQQPQTKTTPPTGTSEPCPHHPGTPERIQTLETRARLKQKLYNPLDNKNPAPLPQDTKPTDDTDH